MTVARWTDAGTARLAALQGEAQRAANMLLAPNCFNPDDVLAALLPATMLALEIAGLTRDEPERCALYDCLRDYCEPAEDPHRLTLVERLPGGRIVA